MSESCIFCDNNLGSREHLWPKWIHERKDFGALRLQRGKSTEKIVPNQELKVKTVCVTCSTGWMSGLEAENIPIIGSMMQDISTPLEGAQQKSIAAWSVKTAMMSDSMKGRNAPNRFYDRDECVNMRRTPQIPDRTRIWIGRVDGMHLGDFGTDFTILSQDKRRIGMGSVATIVAGHFISQVVTLHSVSEYEGHIEISCTPGDWNNMLIQIWPIEKPTVQWPPKTSFTNGGAHGIAYLVDRWRMGDKTDVITK
jgi:hypothetical protein